MTQDQRTLYTAEVRTTGGRDGHARSADGRLDIRLSTPGASGAGTNPEQLFAAGWSACFEGAMSIAARQLKITLPADTAIDAEVDLVQGPDGYRLRARLRVHLPGVEADAARVIIDAAHRTCPYSKAIRGNIDAVVELA